jgi:hypothetical protein
MPIAMSRQAMTTPTMLNMRFAGHLLSWFCCWSGMARACA